MDLSVLIPARNEMFLSNTVLDILAHAEAKTEVIVVLDGQWPVTPLATHERVTVIHTPTSIGQRAATNLAARASEARYVMKLDAHCGVDQGFDAKLIAAGEELGHDVTQIPRMYNLHAFDWLCHGCGNRTYQGPTPKSCQKCRATGPFERVIVWDLLCGHERPRRKRTDFARFDQNLHFQYWLRNKQTGEPAYEDRPSVKAEGDIADTMTSIGACFFMRRDRFFELGGLDEAHGSWGQFGVEIALKSWLSGGRHVVNKRTWFSHMFRTQGGDFGFPYHLSQKAVDQARAHSRKLWLENGWPQAVRPLQWVIDKFAPVPGFHTADMASVQSESELGEDKGDTVDGPYGKGRPIVLPPNEPQATAPAVLTHAPLGSNPSVGLVYYSDGRPERWLLEAVQQQLLRAAPGKLLVSTTLVPMPGFGVNIHMPMERGYLTMFRQILAGLEAQGTDIVFLVEHDVLYHPSHFQFVPPSPDVFYYNQNVWKVDVETGQSLHYLCNQTSGLVAGRNLLTEHYRMRVDRVASEGFSRRMGFEPGTHSWPRGVDNYRHTVWMSEFPNVDLRHGACLTQSRWKKEEFRNQKYTAGWTEADSVPGWGRTLGEMPAFFERLSATPVLV